MDTTGTPAAETTDTIRVISAGSGTTNTAQTAGFERRELVAAPGAWIGVTRTPPGGISGWHHHGDYDTYIYVMDGEARLDFGPEGQRSRTGRAGDLVVIPKGVVHREANTGPEENVALIIRVGTGATVVNVDGPDS